MAQAGGWLGSEAPEVHSSNGWSAWRLSRRSRSRRIYL